MEVYEPELDEKEYSGPEDFLSKLAISGPPYFVATLGPYPIGLVCRVGEQYFKIERAATEAEYIAARGRRATVYDPSETETIHFYELTTD